MHSPDHHISLDLSLLSLAAARAWHRGAEAHRSHGRVEIKSLALEEGVRLNYRLVQDVAGAVQRLAHWHACPNIDIAQARPGLFGAQLAEALYDSGASARRAA
ncbi:MULTISPECIES: hypothetical protein [unclassified Janthinobacterium]|uniref:hypothetical protein n=1 Tax=unclassified Janthinobacterium TaxID=2610881 RepID=UPI0018CB1B3F|nr:hypothetical protein [Janthinobacterium sp. CG_23.4]MDH6157335.1 uncharacterized protein YcaQ [Janthinobacterium sp. CG_23.4]